MTQLTLRSFLAASLLMTAACSEVPLEAHYNRGGPESLLDMSSEVVTVNIGGGASLDELTDWLNREPPTRAELACMDGDFGCAQAKDVLQQFGVSFNQVEDARGSVALFYDRVMTRDCENRYIDNSINPYNLNHPTFGCSTAANMVQMVADKRQFVNPSLLDFMDGEKSVQTYRRYESGKFPTRSSAGSGSQIQGGGGTGLQ